MYLISAFLCAYAGFAALCAITTRNVPLIWTATPSRSLVLALRGAGYLLLALSWVPCSLNWDAPMGTAAWLMVLTAAGLALVFPFAYSPKRSVQAGGVAALMAGLVFLVS